MQSASPLEPSDQTASQLEHLSFARMTKKCPDAQTELEKSIEKIIDVFHSYSVRVGHFDTLTKMELKLLIQKQLPNYMNNQLKPGQIDALFKDLDKNKDQQLSFGEFMMLITKVTIATHEHLHHCGEGEGQHQHQDEHHHH
ncbi:PREDICTED: protein MRP-126-like [Gavialis gangeticus]|uniref:protein MRP-126-like n=1 Tax=Gavialis gangeticus TaxID=94835 RepID=UPI00092F824F|nr:PREDICTED: protein MRP-126-like [Gavialis gangeticus]